MLPGSPPWSFYCSLYRMIPQLPTKDGGTLPRSPRPFVREFGPPGTHRAHFLVRKVPVFDRGRLYLWPLTPSLFGFHTWPPPGKRAPVSPICFPPPPLLLLKTRPTPQCLPLFFSDSMRSSAFQAVAFQLDVVVLSLAPGAMLNVTSQDLFPRLPSHACDCFDFWELPSSFFFFFFFFFSYRADGQPILPFSCLSWLGKPPFFLKGAQTFVGTVTLTVSAPERDCPRFLSFEDGLGWH